MCLNASMFFSSVRSSYQQERIISERVATYNTDDIARTECTNEREEELHKQNKFCRSNCRTSKSKYKTDSSMSDKDCHLSEVSSQSFSICASSIFL